jgi:hypothetical protein
MAPPDCQTATTNAGDNIERMAHLKFEILMSTHGLMIMDMVERRDSLMSTYAAFATPFEFLLTGMAQHTEFKKIKLMDTRISETVQSLMQTTVRIEGGTHVNGYKDLVKTLHRTEKGLTEAFEGLHAPGTDVSNAKAKFVLMGVKKLVKIKQLHVEILKRLKSAEVFLKFGGDRPNASTGKPDKTIPVMDFFTILDDSNDEFDAYMRRQPADKQTLDGKPYTQALKQRCVKLLAELANTTRFCRSGSSFSDHVCVAWKIAIPMPNAVARSVDEAAMVSRNKPASPTSKHPTAGAHSHRPAPVSSMDFEAEGWGAGASDGRWTESEPAPVTAAAPSAGGWAESELSPVTAESLSARAVGDGAAAHAGSASAMSPIAAMKALHPSGTSPPPAAAGGDGGAGYMPAPPILFPTESEEVAAKELEKNAGIMRAWNSYASERYNETCAIDAAIAGYIGVEPPDHRRIMDACRRVECLWREALQARKSTLHGQRHAAVCFPSVDSGRKAWAVKLNGETDNDINDTLKMVEQIEGMIRSILTKIAGSNAGPEIKRGASSFITTHLPPVIAQRPPPPQQARAPSPRAAEAHRDNAVAAAENAAQGVATGAEFVQAAVAAVADACAPALGGGARLEKAAAAVGAIAANSAANLSVVEADAAIATAAAAIAAATATAAADNERLVAAEALAAEIKAKVANAKKAAALAALDDLVALVAEAAEVSTDATEEAVAALEAAVTEGGGRARAKAEAAEAAAVKASAAEAAAKAGAAAAEAAASKAAAEAKAAATEAAAKIAAEAEAVRSAAAAEAAARTAAVAAAEAQTSKKVTSLLDESIQAISGAVENTSADSNKRARSGSGSGRGSGSGAHQRQRVGDGGGITVLEEHNAELQEKAEVAIELMVEAVGSLREVVVAGDHETAKNIAEEARDTANEADNVAEESSNIAGDSEEVAGDLWNPTSRTGSTGSHTSHASARSAREASRADEELGKTHNAVGNINLAAGVSNILADGTQRIANAIENAAAAAPAPAAAAVDSDDDDDAVEDEVAPPAPREVSRKCTRNTLPPPLSGEAKVGPLAKKPRGDPKAKAAAAAAAEKKAIAAAAKALTKKRDAQLAAEVRAQKDGAQKKAATDRQNRADRRL